MLTASIIGNLGRDPETKTAANGKAMCKFSVGCKVGWGDRKSTQWVDVTVFGTLADVCMRSLGKGSQVYASGELTARAYMGKDGEPKAGVDLVAKDVQFIGARVEKSAPTRPTVQIVGPTGIVEDIPF
jgi:single-strand DNA-binding protein